MLIQDAKVKRVDVKVRMLFDKYITFKLFNLGVACESSFLSRSIYLKEKQWIS